MMEIELPFPPSTNHIWRHFRGRTVLSAAGRRFRQQVCAILNAAAVRPMEGKLCCSVTVYPPDRRRRDIDNLLKSLLDALQRGGAFPDDSQIVWLITVKATPVVGGRVLVKLSPLSRTACREMCDAAMPEEASCN